MTIYALFGADVRTIAFDKRADDYFDVITIICIVSSFSNIDNIHIRNNNSQFSKT
jgi:hypothetical protein